MNRDRSFIGCVFLYLKGICMGAADVIPGVSGGTMALILGIYRELIGALSSLDLKWLTGLWPAMSSPEVSLWAHLRRETRRLHLLFFVVLGAGIFSAISAGSAVLPPLLENYPRLVNGFFFGLIIGSVWIPFGRIEFNGNGSSRVLIVLVVVFFLLAGFWITSPERTVLRPQSWVQVKSEGEQLGELLSRKISAESARAVLGDSHNNHLRDQISTKTLKNEAGQLYLPSGTSVYIPRPPGWYLLLAGAVAICAMILPGISGAYLLLILGCYSFVLNLVHLLEARLLAGLLPGVEFFYLALFGFGMVGGLLVFARFLNFMLHKFESLTMGALVGLMVGCLRGLWPYREMKDLSYLSVYSGLIVVCGLLGALIVFLLGYFAAGDLQTTEANRD